MYPNSISSYSNLPIFIIGAGGIVNDAHLPAYALAGYNVQGIYDVDILKASETAAKFNIPFVFNNIKDLTVMLTANAIVDVAVPGSELLVVLDKLPIGTNVLLQKPMGENLTMAKEILALTQQKKMCAAVNFQLRYAPFIIAANKLIKNSNIGNVLDIEINVNVNTPWHLWDFLHAAPRVEILYHSIHYIDLIRHFLGNPNSVFAKTTNHPSMPKIASVKSNIIMDYGESVRANILTNHCHKYGLSKQQSYIKIEGSKGAIKINFGTLIDYPKGAADSFEYILLEEGKEALWQENKIEGSWFPHAFIGSMQEMMKTISGEIDKPDNSVDDCIHTMACVEAAYRSNEIGGIKLTDV
jgi:predicted dehydrogenase